MAYSAKARDFYSGELQGMKDKGIFKEERYIQSPQAANIKVEFPGGRPKQVLNFCANNYLGLSSHPEVVKAAHEGLDSRGYGMSSVRFICGTQDIHRELEKKLTEFLGTEDTMPLPLLHGCQRRAVRRGARPGGRHDRRPAGPCLHRGRHAASARPRCSTTSTTTWPTWRRNCRRPRSCRFRMIITDGVFSMDGDIAPLDKICDLADKYDAMVMVDDSHATGFIGKTGRGTHEHCGVMGRVDIITTTLGKALGGASGGCVSGPKEIVEMCRQRARPYLFSNTMPPVVVAGSLKVLELLSKSTDRRDKLEKNTIYWQGGPDQGRVRHQAGRHPHRPGDALQRQAGPGHRPRPVPRGDLRDRASSSRWWPRARPGSGPRSRPATRWSTWTRPWRPSPRSARSTGYWG